MFYINICIYFSTQEESQEKSVQKSSFISCQLVKSIQSVLVMTTSFLADMVWTIAKFLFRFGGLSYNKSLKQTKHCYHGCIDFGVIFLPNQIQRYDMAYHGSLFSNIFSLLQRVVFGSFRYVNFCIILRHHFN